MSMDYTAANAIVVEEEELNKLNLNTFTKFNQKLKEEGLSAFDIIDEINFAEVKGELGKAFDLFAKDFENKTGIRIYLGYHDKEDHGSRNDEVDGFFYYLNEADLYQPTEAHKELAKKIDFEDKYFVVFG